MQKIIASGNLGRTPTMRTTRTGQQVTDFSMAVNRKYNDRSGETQNETTWFNVTCWGRIAEVASEYLKKGDKVLVEGRVGMEQYTDHAGALRTNLVITATDLEMMGGPGNNEVAEEEEEILPEEAEGDFPPEEDEHHIGPY